MVGTSDAPASVHAVRAATTRDCLLAVREADQPLTVAQIAMSTGLSRPTVDSVLQDLIGTGLIAPAAAAERQPGRPARRFRLVPAAAHLAALDLGARSVECVITDAAGAVTSRSTVPLRADDITGSLAAAVRATGQEPQSVGVSVPGIIGPDGRVAQSLALPELAGAHLGEELGERLGCPIAVENDIKLAAYAEARVHPQARSLALVQLGHRISVALVLDGEILQGSHRLAGELGIQRGMRWTSSSQRGRLRWSTGDQARDLLQRARDGEEAARAEIDAFCAEIAPRLAGLLLAADPELLVVGGGLSRAGEVLLGPLRRHLHHQLLMPEPPQVVAAQLEKGGSLVGALGRAFENGSAHLAGVPGIPPPWAQLGAATAAAAPADLDPTTPGPTPEGSR